MSHGLSWSARVGFYPDPDPEYMQLGPYLYVANKPTAFGWIPTARLRMKKGEWTSICIGVRLNTPGVADGTIEFSVNGSVVSAGGIVYRKSRAVVVDAIWFNTFFGGSGPSAAPSTTQFARFKNPRTNPI